MPHYPQCFTINRLRVEAHLGYYDDERAATQPVEVSVRIYFPQAPACASDDHGAFIDYAELCTLISDAITGREFRLIEYMAQELFLLVRAKVNAQGGAEAALWLELTKCLPPVPHLQSGASFVLSDVPANASVVEVAA